MLHRSQPHGQTDESPGKDARRHGTYRGDGALNPVIVGDRSRMIFSSAGEVSAWACKPEKLPQFYPSHCFVLPVFGPKPLNGNLPRNKGSG